MKQVQCRKNIDIVDKQSLKLFKSFNHNPVLKQLFLFIFLFNLLISFAQNKSLVNDTSNVVLRKMDVKTYTQQKDFQYDEASEPMISLWDRFWNWFWKMIDNILNTKTGSAIFHWGFVAAAVALIAFFIFRLMGMNKNKLFTKDSGGNIDYNVANNDIHGIDFNAAIEAAIAKNNYRIAIRLMYLQTLKLLTESNLIDWKINKTNATYVQELNGHQQQYPFIQLTNYFDKTWYGATTIEAAQFDQLKQSFYQFQQQVKQ